MSEEKNCGKCALYHNGACLRSGIRETAEHSCSSWTEFLDNCDICGKPMIKPLIAIYPKGAHQVCRDCAKHYSTCALCQNKKCEFEENPDPMPKAVNQQVRQGNMVMMQTVPNKERIDKFCPVCPCYNTVENCCNREFGICGNHKGIYD